VTIPQTHPLAISIGDFGISPYLQELMSYVGQDDVFERGSEDIEKFLRISMNKKQIERVSKYYGQQIQALNIKEHESVLPEVEEEGEIVYAMMDGSMIYTREEEWKEVKLGRIFKSKSLYSLSNNRNWIKDSVYVGHIGKHDAFLDKFEFFTDQYDDDLVFVCDGAPWIWNWIMANYPKSIQILDYYHALQHLLFFAGLFFKEKKKKVEWVEKQKELLWQDKTEEVIKHISELNPRSKKAKEEQRKLINYYTKNKARMQYGSFKKRGLLVGSGPIESANRTVIQKRMKLSGQRWTMEGAQNILDLRITHLNGNWDKIIQLVDGKLVA